MECPNALGPPVPADYTVIGVMPETFQFPGRETRAWTPAQLAAPNPRAVPRGSMLARLADDASPESAAAEVLPLIRRIRAGQPDNHDAVYEFVGVHEELVRPALLV